MGIVSLIFSEVFVRPMFNALVALFSVLPGNNLAFAIILLTVLIRILLYPLSRKSVASQEALRRLQPEVQKIKERHSGDRERQSRATMELYQREGVNPFSGCLPLLIQLPILLALYRVFLRGFDPSNFTLLYSFIPHPGVIEGTIFGFIDLSQRSVILALVAGALQYWQSRQVMRRSESRERTETSAPDMAAMMGKQMAIVAPAITIFISLGVPAGLPLYWITTTTFSIIQQWRTRAMTLVV